MTDHLPECPISIGDMSVMVDGVTSTVVYYCSCVSLRRCEERVEESMDRAWTHTLRLKQLEAFANGLDAAREAVAALPCMAGRGQDRHPRHVDDFKDAVLAAIRALKEKP